MSETRNVSMACRWKFGEVCQPTGLESEKKYRTHIEHPKGRERTVFERLLKVNVGYPDKIDPW